jgi:hypothetical protein
MAVWVHVLADKYAGGEQTRTQDTAQYQFTVIM